MKVFLTDFVGLSTRLECLSMAFVISDYFGHEVCLDWPELDSFNVIGTRRESLGLTGRLGALRMRDYSDQLFFKIKDHRKVILRTDQGPAHLLERYRLPTAKRIKLRPDYVQVIRDTFGAYANRPVVGVHIRRGDFNLTNEDTFDAKSAEWPATPTWWYEFALQTIIKTHPNTAFFLSCTGDPNLFNELKKNFDVFDLPTSSPYGYKGPDHDSKRHPVADLFALGCCGLIVASSCSTFSHYAANALGSSSACLIPPPQTTKGNPKGGVVELYGQGVNAWREACREGTNVQLINRESDVPIPAPAQIDWM
jgi:hypothetical protein